MYLVNSVDVDSYSDPLYERETLNFFKDFMVIIEEARDVIDKLKPESISEAHHEEFEALVYAGADLDDAMESLRYITGSIERNVRFMEQRW